jgi:MoaA/NifB/PqqE/SkfB family radical SAM enzyme
MVATADNIIANTTMKPEELHFVQVETSNYCNYRCQYCQMSYNRIPQHLMSFSDFNQIINQLADLPALEMLYLNGYNEPTLVPDIVEQVRLTAHLPAEVVLLTNGTGLTEQKFEELAHARTRLTIDIHLSAIDPLEYSRLHGVPLNPILLPRLHAIAKRGNIPGTTLRMMVMGIGDNRHHENWEDVRNFFADTNMEVGLDLVHDRAGCLPNPYYQGFQHKNVISCGLDNRPVQWIHITVRGNWVICCQDYDEQYVFGNVLEQGIRSIAKSKKRLDVIARAMGRISEPQSTICKQCYYAIIGS